MAQEITKKVKIRNLDQDETLYIKVGVFCYSIEPGKEQEVYVSERSAIYFERDRDSKAAPHRCCKSQ